MEARILPAPQVAYKGPTPQKLNMVMPGSGTWDLRGKQFLQACTSIDRWCVSSFLSAPIAHADPLAYAGWCSSSTASSTSRSKTCSSRSAASSKVSPRVVSTLESWS